MLKSDLHFDLPEHLIAQHPPEQRGSSRLLHMDSEGMLHDLRFPDLGGLLRAGDLLVFNDTRVIPARMFGRKDSGGRVEILVERLLGGSSVLAHVRASKAPKPGTAILLEDGATRCLMRERAGDCFVLEFEGGEPLTAVLARVGHVPLPPYIARPDDKADLERYQTVYARREGAVAAPTAGLHFDADFLNSLAAQGVETAFLTLHVGSGTFQPLRVERLEEHKMHAEYCEVGAELVSAIQRAKERGGRVVAVGTTSSRALETAARGGEIAPYAGDTDIFITPGFAFRCVDALLTNFHLPGSTLLALVSAFAGHAEIMGAYRYAVEGEYRFFSYGDAMFLTPNRQDDSP